MGPFMFGPPRPPMPPGPPGLQYPQQQQQMQSQYAQPMPYQPSAGENIVKGINDFVVNYKAANRAAKEEAQQRALQAIEMARLGIPIDQKKVLKDMKRAGWNIDTEAPTPEQISWERQKMSGEMAAKQASMQSLLMPQAPQMGPGGQNAGMMAAPQQMQVPMPNMMGMQGGMAPGMPGGPPMGPRPAGPPPPNFMQRLGQMVGIGRQEPSLSSPTGQWLSSLQQRGMREQQHATEDSEETRYFVKESRKIFKGILQGDPKAAELGYRLGMGQLLPNEGFFKLAEEAGMSRPTAARAMLGITLGEPAMKAQMMKTAIEMAPNFRNQQGGPDPAAALSYMNSLSRGELPNQQPQMDLDTAFKLKEYANKLQELHPTLPRNVAELAANALTFHPDGKLASLLRDQVSKFPTKGTIGLQKDIVGWNMQEKQLGQQWKVHRENWELGVANSVRQAQGQAFDSWWKIYNDKESTEEQREAAASGLADALSGVEVPLPGGVRLPGGSVSVDRVKKWGNLLIPGRGTDQPVIRPKGATKKDLGQFVGGAPATSNMLDRVLTRLGGVADMGLEEAEAFGDWVRRRVMPDMLRGMGFRNQGAFQRWLADDESEIPSSGAKRPFEMRQPKAGERLKPMKPAPTSALPPAAWQESVGYLGRGMPIRGEGAASPTSSAAFTGNLSAVPQAEQTTSAPPITAAAPSWQESVGYLGRGVPISATGGAGVVSSPTATGILKSEVSNIPLSASLSSKPWSDFVGKAADAGSKVESSLTSKLLSAESSLRNKLSTLFPKADAVDTSWEGEGAMPSEPLKSSSAAMAPKAETRNLTAVRFPVGELEMVKSKAPSLFNSLPARKAASREIIISLPDKKAALLENGKTVKLYSIVLTGAADAPTPVGKFRIMERIPWNGRVMGKAWMGFSYNKATNWYYGIHGFGPDHNETSTNGCIALDNKDVVDLFKRVSVDDPVTVLDTSLISEQQ